jgi:hypothetical protein
MLADWIVAWLPVTDGSGGGSPDLVVMDVRDLADGQLQRGGKRVVGLVLVSVVDRGVNERETRERASALVAVRAGLLAGEDVAGEQDHVRDEAFCRVPVGERLDVRREPEPLAGGERRDVVFLGDRDRVHSA